MRKKFTDGQKKEIKKAIFLNSLSGALVEDVIIEQKKQVRTE